MVPLIKYEKEYDFRMFIFSKKIQRDVKIIKVFFDFFI